MKEPHQVRLVKINLEMLSKIMQMTIIVIVKVIARIATTATTIMMAMIKIKMMMKIIIVEK